MPTLRLMTLNLRSSDADDGPNAWPERWPHIRALLTTLKPDVLGVQECMPNQLVALMGELPGYFTYAGPDTMICCGQSPRNPVFVCEPCILPCTEAALALNDSGVIGQQSWGAAQPRLAHVLRFEGWTLVNTHFDNKSALARQESARLLADFLQDEPTAVIMGDFNCGPADPPLQLLREAGFIPAKDSLPPEEERRTFHKFSGAGLAELDFILLRGVGAVERVQIPRPRQQAPYLSDHDPLVVDVVIGD